MGIAVSNQQLDEQHSSLLYQELKADDKAKYVYRMLLAGTKNSGKSTLARHLVQIYGERLNDEERLHYRPYVYRDTLKAFRALSSQLVDLGGLQNLKTIESKVALDLLDEDAEIDEQSALNIEIVWKDHEVQAYTKTGELQISESASYFFDRIHQIGEKDYLPTDDDILRIGAKVTGIVEHIFSFEKNKFMFLDPNGQRNESKKWASCFKDVLGLCFVASLSAFDEPSADGDNDTALHDSIKLFEEYCGSRWFGKKPIILFLNKADIFRDKIRKTTLQEYFPDFREPPTYEKAIDYIASLFACKVNPSQEFYWHACCATDADNIKRIKNVVSEIVIKASLREARIIP